MKHINIVIIDGVMAEIWMVFGAEEYKYGTYRFVTRAEKNRVNDLAMQIRKERGCETYVKEMNYKNLLELNTIMKKKWNFKHF